MKLGLVASGIQPTLHPVTALVRLLSLVAIADSTPWRGGQPLFSGSPLGFLARFPAPADRFRHIQNNCLQTPRGTESR